MRFKKLGIYSLVIALVFILFINIKIALAAHEAAVSNDPGTVDRDSHSDFDLTVTNDKDSTHDITHVILSVNENFGSVDATTPTDWTVNIAGNSITWQVLEGGPKIEPNSQKVFEWEATAPTETGYYTHSVLTIDDLFGTDNNSFLTTVTDIPEFPVGLAVVFVSCLLVYTFFRKFQ